MVIISKATLKTYSEKHSDCEAALQLWYDLTKTADWKNFSQMRQTFNTVDAVGNDRYVFNIKGNQHRLIVLIIFKTRTVFILFIGTHAEYDKIDAATVTYKR